MPIRTYGNTMNFGFDWSMTPIVKKLLIANVAAFVLMTIAQAAGLGMLVRSYWMLTPFAVTRQFAVWQLVTYMFLHGGFWHILFNLFALWMFGSEIERTWGSKKFLRYYFLTGIGAGITVVLFGPSSMIPTLGASGAIYGILLAYGVLFPNRVIFVPILFFFFVPIPAKYLVMILGGFAFLSALSSPGDFVSHTAHLGGMAFGLLYLKGTQRSSKSYFDFRNLYYRWKRQRLQRKFEVYMSKRNRDDKPRGPWVN